MTEEELMENLSISIKNLTMNQAIVIQRFFKDIEYAGKVGTSRYFALMADGDGNFHPIITIDSDTPLNPNLHFKATDEKEVYAHIYDQDAVKTIGETLRE